MQRNRIALSATLLTAATLGAGMMQGGVAQAAPAAGVVHQGPVGRAQLPSNSVLFVDRAGDVSGPQNVVRGTSSMNDMLCMPAGASLNPFNALSATYDSHGTGESASVTEMSFRTPAQATAARNTVIGWYQHCTHRLNGATSSAASGRSLAKDPSTLSTRWVPAIAFGLEASAPATDTSRTVENTTVVQVGNRLMVARVLSDNPRTCTLDGRHSTCAVYTQSPYLIRALAR